MNKFIKSAVAAGVLVAVGASVVHAATITNTFQVRANVLARCTTVTAATLNFGDYTPGLGALTASTNIVSRCTRGTAMRIGLSGGGANNTSARRMVHASTATEFLTYSLATPTNTNWGENFGVDTVQRTGAGLGTDVTVAVTGTLPDSVANQDAEVGAYADTVQVTVDY